ncbi:9509_t:CDS:2, partial [Diversispora eburnea]
MNDEPEISPDLPINDGQWAIDHSEDPDKFVTITEKNRDLAHTYHDRLCSDADMIQFAKVTDDDPDTLMDMSRRE